MKKRLYKNNMKKTFYSLLTILFWIIVILFCKNYFFNDERSKKGGETSYYFVSRVIDGDTFIIKDENNKSQRVRLIGIDAPESIKSEHKDIQFYGKESSRFLKKFLTKKYVRLEYDVRKKDKYRRILAYVYLKDGTFVNSYLVKKGYAKSVSYRPNTRHQSHLNKMEKIARKKQIGMWKKQITK